MSIDRIDQSSCVYGDRLKLYNLIDRVDQSSYVYGDRLKLYDSKLCNFKLCNNFF